jgi:UDP-N-acetylmuramyl tripeptide synthase
MKIVQQRLLRGANMYSAATCIAAIIELDAATVEISPQAMALLPGALRAAGDAAALVAALMLHLQQECGHAVAFAHAEPVAGRPLQRRVVVQYEIEHVAQAALRAAVPLVHRLLHGEAFEPAAAREALRALAQGMALPAQMQAVAEHARALGYPVLRVSEHANLLTVGWGSRQWRFLDDVGADSRLLGNAILQSAQLTRAMWSEALLDVTEVGEVADVDGVVNVRRGRATHDVAEVRDVCELAAAKLGLTDARLSIVEGGKHGLRLAGVEGQASRDYDAAARLAQLDLDPQRGRIPVIAVTGTNGKTTTTLMIAHATRLAGLRTAHTTTQGVFFDGRRVQPGDCTGYWSHRSVLTAPQIDCAVLETARGGLLKRGLAFDRCSVGVMLNVSADHLGLDGVDTLADLARVKALVVRNAGCAVLNADDVHCVAASEDLLPDARIVFFSMQADSPVLLAHLRQGGRGVWLENETIMLGEGDSRQPVMAVGEIPATVGGLARYNIANSLAATAALQAVGLTLPQIAAGLASFVSDAVTNPLRTNIFHVGGMRIVLDYAHNAAAYTALGALTRGLVADSGQEQRQHSGSVLAVVSSPGDRRDDDLRMIGASCAQAFDRLFVYELASRGRQHGETSRLIGEGALAAGSAYPVETFGNPVEALQRAHSECQPGDIMMFSCGTSITTLIEALRAVDGEAAAAIEAQASAPG